MAQTSQMQWTNDQVDAIRRQRDSLQAEVHRLRADLAAALDDRARFPDKPDAVGRMIEAHIGNLKIGKEEANRHACDSMTRSSIEIGRLRAALRECAAKWESPPTTMTAAAGYVAKEFQRRMDLAAAALGTEQ